MNWLDIVLIVLGLLGLVVGIKMGLLQAIFLVGGMIVGVIIAAQISGPLADALTDSVGNESLASAIAYGIILIAIVTVSQIIVAVIKKMLAVLFLGWIDRMGGAALGLAAGAVAGAALLAIFARLAFLIPEDIPNIGSIDIDAREKMEEALTDSGLIPYYLDAYRGLPANAIGSIPGDFEVALEELQARIDAADAGDTG